MSIKESEMARERLRSPEYTARTSCRSCDSTDFQEVLDLGVQKIVGFGSEEPPRVPLTLMLCNQCSLVQLKHTTRPELLWNEHYGYRSGVNSTMKAHLEGLAREAEQISGVKPGDVVVDIGCNDGTLLAGYQTPDIKRVGFDPSTILLPYAYNNLRGFGFNNFQIFGDFFNKWKYERYGWKKAKVVTAIAMFYDLDDPNKFLGEVKGILVSDGRLIIQQNYLLGMLQQNAFDNACHEHLEYYSLTSMENLLRRHALEVVHVEETPINGGSFRTHIVRRGVAEVDSTVLAMRQKEASTGLTEVKTYQDFASRVKQVTTSVRDFVEQARTEGKIVYVYGASTRGGTLLQTCRLDQGQIKAAVERNPDKWGKIMEATGIPIISEEQARIEKCDIGLILPWFFHEEIISRDKELLESGVKFLVPLPRPKIVFKNGERLL